MTIYSYHSHHWYTIEIYQSFFRSDPYFRSHLADLGAARSAWCPARSSKGLRQSSGPCKFAKKPPSCFTREHTWWWTTHVHRLGGLVHASYVQVDDVPPQKYHENNQGWFSHQHDPWDEPPSSFLGKWMIYVNMMLFHRKKQIVEGFVGNFADTQNGLQWFPSILFGMPLEMIPR